MISGRKAQRPLDKVNRQFRGSRPNPALGLNPIRREFGGDAPVSRSESSRPSVWMAPRVRAAREIRQGSDASGASLAIAIDRLTPVAHVTLPLNADQIALLCSAEPGGVAARTLKGHSELRWLAHLGLLSTDDGARHRLNRRGAAADRPRSHGDPRLRLTNRGMLAVATMIDMASHSNGGPTRMADVADRQGISRTGMETMFGKLRRHKLVKAWQGPGGGKALARNAAEISVGDIGSAPTRFGQRSPSGWWNISTRSPSPRWPGATSRATPPPLRTRVFASRLPARASKPGGPRPTPSSRRGRWLRAMRLEGRPKRPPASPPSPRPSSAPVRQ